MKYLDWGIYNFIVQEIILSKEKRNYSCCHLIFTKVSRIKVFLGVAFRTTYCNGLIDTIVMCSEGLVYKGGNSHEREVTYYYTDDCGLDLLMKKVRDPEKGIFSGFIWKADEKVWNEKWELTCGYF